MNLNKFVFKCVKKYVRNIHVLNVNGVKESIIQKTDYPDIKCENILKNKIISVLGYGPQGRGQALNLRDNGYKVILGLRESGSSWLNAIDEGWMPGQTLFSCEEATDKGQIVKYLLSDAGQIATWDKIKPHLTTNKTLYFSHGFGIVYNDQTKIVPPTDIDVVLVAPKGPGSRVRYGYLENSGVNSSYAVHQDFTGGAENTALALAFAIGSKNVFKTTFKNEVYSDLTGERCVLMGMIQGAFKAQYDVLRENGHSQSEAYNETVEEALVSLYPLINNRGMDWMFSNCSTTAQRGALDWAPVFEKTIKPIIDDCYKKVISGKEATRSIDANSDSEYRSKLNKELDVINNQEIWQVAKQLRKLR